MRLLVTGAAGFLGRYVVAEALRRGHRVRALDRPGSELNRLPWSQHPAVELVETDLSGPGDLYHALREVDGVVHLAAAKEGSYAEQYAGTVNSTSNLLDAMRLAGVLRLVLIGSFSAFDYLGIAEGETIDEETPLEPDPSQRDAYAQVKLLQEEMVRRFGSEPGARVTIVRAGVIYGWGHLWNPRLGVALRPDLWIRIGRRARIPLSYVENCAEAILSTAEREEAVGHTLHIVDDDLPTQRGYADAVVKRVAPPPRTIPVSWALMRALARLAWVIDERLLGGRLPLPGVLVPARLHARFKPLLYSNERAKRILAWSPRHSLEAALERSCSGVDPLQTARLPDPGGAAADPVG